MNAVIGCVRKLPSTLFTERFDDVSCNQSPFKHYSNVSKMVVLVLEEGKINENYLKKRGKKGQNYTVACFCLFSSLESNVFVTYRILKQKIHSLDRTYVPQLTWDYITFIPNI